MKQYRKAGSWEGAPHYRWTRMIQGQLTDEGWTRHIHSLVNDDGSIKAAFKISIKDLGKSSPFRRTEREKFETAILRKD